MTADTNTPGPKANLLLVDDQPANLLALEAILDDLGYNLVRALSGEETLRLLQEREFAAVLLDVRMPTMDGFETATRIRRREQSRHTPIIFLTAYDDHRFPVDQAYALGAVDYLVKPLVPVILRAKVTGFVELFQKTEQIRRQAERLRQMERREFEQKLAAENARLRESERRLREADRRKDEFLAMLAHELRNPLAPIRNAVHVMKLLDTPDPNVRRSRDMIERQVQHLARLVDDLLEVSRITSGKIKLYKEPVDLAAVVARAVETSRPLIDARRHRLTVTLPPQTVCVEGDVTRLAQVLANLLNNAAKYTPDGGQIWLTAEAAGGEAVVRVRDTGMGIAADLLPTLFELFTQGDRSLARSEGGLGIGLTLVKRLVEMHGGRVEVSSAGPGKGSEFTVRLPALPPGTVRRAAAAACDLTDAPCRRVLVVDDNKDSAESLAMLLAIKGHEVSTAHDGPGALEAARTFRPEVVLLDIGLPGMDGFTVAQRLREQPEFAQVGLLALTGYGQEEDRRRAEEAGFNAHMVKPADVDALQLFLANWAPSPG
jgi:signal transduction histidine kinase